MRATVTVDRDAYHEVFEQIGRFALEVEEGRVPQHVAVAFERFMVTMATTAAEACKATSPQERDGILDRASAELHGLSST